MRNGDEKPVCPYKLSRAQGYYTRRCEILVLTLKPGKAISLSTENGPVQIWLDPQINHNVRLAFDAPPSVGISRQPREPDQKNENDQQRPGLEAAA